jgi:GNAT superfamily N-acetyltransferase
MLEQKESLLELQFKPVTPDLWLDFEKLFGDRGACGGCWCMWWRLPHSIYTKQTDQVNKESMKGIIMSGEVPGILAYQYNEPFGWCSLGPRQIFAALDRSRILTRIDDQPVWSIVCFFVAKPYRRKGVTVQLLQEAVRFAREHGANILEGYPIDTRTTKYPDAFAYTGTLSAFLQAGFTEVARRSEKRPIMRYYL